MYGKKILLLLYSNGADLKLGSSTYFFLLYSFLVLTKCEVLNFRVGRSCDQVLQRAYCSQEQCMQICSVCGVIIYRKVVLGLLSLLIDTDSPNHSQRKCMSDNSENWYWNQVPATIFSIMYYMYISLVRGRKEKIYFDPSWFYSVKHWYRTIRILYCLSAITHFLHTFSPSLLNNAALSQFDQEWCFIVVIKYSTKLCTSFTSRNKIYTSTYSKILYILSDKLKN